MKSNFTLDLVKSMRSSLIASKVYHGYNILSDGTLEDCLGATFKVKLIKTTSEEIETYKWVLHAK